VATLSRMKQCLSITLLLILASHLSLSQEFIRENILKITAMAPDKDYGATEARSIKVGRIENQKYYFNALTGPNGEQVKYKRLGSCCEYKSKNTPLGKGFLDLYEVWYDGLKTPVRLYLNGYEYETLFCPTGFSFTKSSEVSEVKFPDPVLTDSIFCNKANTYSVDDFLIKSKLGEFPKPATAPKYPGGIAKLREFFADKKLTDSRAANSVFRVVICFVVNCKGDAGNFQIITEGKGDLSELAQQVLEKAVTIPGKWNPAIVNSQSVDAYQILSFTIMSGALDKVSYRE
jgi:hypothetical protein